MELDAIIQLAEARRKSGRPEDTMALYERAVRISRVHGGPSLEGWVQTHYGDMYCDLKRRDAALERYDTARSLFESVGGVGHLIWLSAHYIDAHRQFGDPREAVRVAERMLPMAAEPSQSVWVHWHVALARADLGQYAEAEESLQISVDYHRTVHDNAGLAHMLLLLGEVRAAAGRTNAAREALTEALDLAERVNVPRMVRQITEDLDHLHEGRPLRGALAPDSGL